jgi:hypothetical protein
MEIREYVVTYITKEYLQRNGWTIIAYNPPGSQGTFTIPDPSKDGNYKGQTGSLSPDIIALKKTQKKYIFLIVEAKPDYNKDDISKMKNMFKDERRKKVFFQIITGYTKANDIPFDDSLESEIHFIKAHGGTIGPEDTIGTILISQIDSNFDPKIIDPKQDIYSKFKVEFTKLFSED